ncbi:ABC transporter substrate-binding protein [Marinobacter sp. 1-3A]|uniref:MlaC/ttg2D family ABC transporter substrate-binding protein n=1 Tax=Marinobacter sp. 1-3A TaxID=2582920 RepID=UPI00190889E5|nr:ABC transporter substrate-binding protein [Marinobacter sp. 1-3A]MBK1873393.1 ABC transporter substrate-binding protein [Marinobacter sp. 1-3A]
MIALTQRFFLAFTLMALCVASVQAGPEDDLQQYVDENTQKLVRKLTSERGLYERDPEAFYQNMDDALEDFVDFRRIAARVMGRYARQATPEQRNEFVVKFKRSLFDSYAQALMSADNFEIKVRGATINPGDDNRASVAMEVITASGNRHSVTYSMYRKDESSNWMMENVIVEGVNIGLSFRDRFTQEMEANRGQVEVVIDGWSDAVKSLNLEDEVNKS